MIEFIMIEGGHYYITFSTNLDSPKWQPVSEQEKDRLLDLYHTTIEYQDNNKTIYFVQYARR